MLIVLFNFYLIKGSDINFDFIRHNSIFSKIIKYEGFPLIPSLPLIKDTNYTICKNAIDKMLKRNVKDPNFRPFMEFGGRKLNDYGNYDECEKTSNSTFFIAGIVPSTASQPLVVVGT